MATPPTKPTSSHQPTPSWVSKIITHDTIINFFSDYISVPCFAIFQNDLKKWHQLTVDNKQRPQHFEIFYGKLNERTEYSSKCFKLAANTRKPVLGSHIGFYDYFVPIVKNNRCEAFIKSGPFLKSIPSLEQLTQRFTEISGAPPGQSDPQFLDYCRTALEVQVLNQKVLPHYLKLLQIIARILGSDKEEIKLVMQIEKLKSTIFSQLIPNRMWNYVAVKESRLGWGPWQMTELAPWDRSEFKLTRHPTVVMAVMLHNPGNEQHDEAVSLIEAAEMQLACFDFTKKLTETISGKMGNEGVYFLTSPNPSWDTTKTKLHLQDTARSIESFLLKTFKKKIFIGISSQTHSPQELPEAFKESVQALHLGLHIQKTILFFEDHYQASDHIAEVSLYEWFPRLLEASTQGAEKETQLIREQYIKSAIQSSGKNQENLRSHFLHALFFLLETAQKRGLLTSDKAAELRRELLKKFIWSNTVADLLSLFRYYLDLLNQIFLSPLRGERNIRLEQSREYILKNYQQSISLKEMASQFGMSESRFSQHFKKMYGMGFLEYLLQVRCDNAKRLLETTHLPINLVTQECGFRSTNHFIQCFKRRNRITPRKYRNLKTSNISKKN
jgi:two-component system response regulator YesN